MKRVAGRWLLIHSGSLEGRRIALKGQVSIGRGAETNVQLLDREVSRRHACLLELDDGEFRLVDLASENGTWLGEGRVTSVTLQPGDVFSVGASRFEYSVEAGDWEDGSMVKLASGPAEDATMRLMTLEEAEHSKKAEPPSCTHALHETAKESGWAYCPACGAIVC